MREIIDFFYAVGFIPHGYCMLWRWDLVLLHAGSDTVIAVSYFTIPIAIRRVLRGRNDIQHPIVGVLFAAFIAACAMTHVINLTTLWLPLYGVEGIVKLACAAISGVTAVILWRLVPTLTALPGPAQLAAKNAELETEIARRRAAEAELQRAHAEVTAINAELEGRVLQRTAALQRANEELERFAYIASHDLRAPLRALMTVPDWLRETLTEKYGEVADELETDLREMEVQSRRMDRLLTDLLTYARIGQFREMATTIEPADQIRECASLSALPDGFRLEISPDLPPIHGVPTEFALVMRNLISNAVRHHDRPTGTIRISGARDGDNVTLRISDDGPGIAREYAEKIFEMFSTLRPRDEVEGSGMGLAMVRKIVENAGGFVRLGGPDGPRGAVFELGFPAAAAQGNSA